MSLKKFREEDKKKNQIIVFTIVCILLIAGVFLYQSYALFETKDNFNVVSGSIEKPGDLSFAFYVNDEIVLEAPSKESNLALSEKSNCNNGVTVSWNVESWNASVDYSNYKQEKTSKTKCNLFFREAMYSDYVTSCGENGNTAVDCMKKYSDKDTINLVYDETVDNNLRYIGADPNNYVSFNNELWRIIGVMENIDDGTGKKDARIKLIRNESIGNYSWDTSLESINLGIGVNEWSQAKIMKLLNSGFESEEYGGSLYWNSQSGYCYKGANNKTESCDFTNIGLNADSKRFIQAALWNTGSNSVALAPTSVTNSFKSSQLYTDERSENIGKSCVSGNECNDSVTRTTTWIGSVGLMYPSDYFLATGGQADVRNQCMNLSPYDYQQAEKCYSGNWLFTNEPIVWTMTPANTLTIADTVFDIRSEYGLYAEWAWVFGDIYPTLYLKGQTRVIHGSGTKDSPYKVEI